MYCSPAHHEFSKEGTCYSREDLVTIGTELNKVLHTHKINIKSSKKNLHSQIKEALKSKCGDKEFCWIEQDFLDFKKKKEIEDAFRPKKPIEWYKNRRTWLNTFDILFVMEQYEELHTDFWFLGVYPIDFELMVNGHCVGDIMCTLNVKKILSKHKKQFGMVINTDPHDKGGQHWFAIYCSLDPTKENFGIYQYDSTAYNKNADDEFNDVKPALDFMDKVKLEINNIFPKKIASKFEVRTNLLRRQFKNTECGMFSIVFLTQCLKNIKFDHICEKMKKDDEINLFRDDIYRPSI
jgi:hypothetical protein